MEYLVNLLLILLFLIYYTSCTLIHKKFEYKYSFKPPYLAQKDGSVPFWEYGGNAIAGTENVRIAPSLKSQKGAIWTKKPIDFEWWETDIAFQVTGRGRIGADGLAFWYTQNKGSYDGDVFGSSDRWVGLGLFFDSFDNDNKHNNPYIMAIVNDGTKQFDHQNDGSTQQLAGCAKDFRNKPFPTRARIEYYQNTLTVLFHNGMTNNEQDYEMCLRAENVFLPKGGYFGVSAATGGLADDHDVIHFLTSSLYAPGQFQINQVANDEQKKLQDEYQDYQRKLDQQKADYKKEHPDEKDDMEGWYETDNQRELRQIFQGQAEMFNLIRELSRKLDEVVGRQERTMSLITQVSTSGGVVPQGGAPPPPQGQTPPAGSYIDGMRRHEVDAMFNDHKQMTGTILEIKQFILELKQRADTIINNQARQPTAQVQSVGYDAQSIVSEMRDGLNHVKLNIAQLAQKAGSSGTKDCPNVSCVSITAVLGIAVLQLLIIVGYNIYRDNKDSHAKKFY